MGNTLLRDYNVEKEPFLTAGFQNLWKIYKGKHKDRNTDVSVFFFDKKNLEKFNKEQKDEVINILKKEASSLAKYKHPGILGLVELPLEDKTSLAFVTEPFQFSLTTYSETIGKLEVKLLINSMIDALTFLHDDAKVIHGTINPDNVFVTSSGQVKIGGLPFSTDDPSIEGADFKINDRNAAINPNVKYLAPEIVFDEKVFYTSDMFSVGLSLYTILSIIKKKTDSEPIAIGTNNSLESYKRGIDALDAKISQAQFDNEDADIIRLLTRRKQNTRPTAKEFINHNWFNDPKLKSLKFIESLETNESTKNQEFLTKFPNIVHFFDDKIIVKRFLPAFMSVLKNENLITNTLPCIFAISENKDMKIDFEELVWPGLKELFKNKQIPAAGLYFILSKLNFLAEKVSNLEFSSNMLNIICKALDCNVPKIQSVVLENLLFIIKKIDSQAFKTQLFPRLVNIVLNTNSNAIKIQILKTFTSVYNLLDQTIINESLLNTLEKIVKSDNIAEVSMCVVAIYEEIAKSVSVKVSFYIIKNLSR